MAIELSTAGITVNWAVETTAGTRPETGYSMIRGVKSIPEFGTDVNTLQSTTLDKTRFHTYILGLQDPGGAIGLTVNDYQDFRTDWSALLAAYNTAKASGLAMWVEYKIPDMDSFYYTAEPSTLGFGGADVDEVLENIANFVPTGEPVWAAAST